jgi:hypothetical protein
MWPIYASAIHGAISMRLSEREAAAVDELLGKLSRRCANKISRSPGPPSTETLIE